METKNLDRLVNVSTWISFCAFVALFILRVTGVIAWSWWWVLSPIIVPLVVVIVAIIFVVKELKQ